MSLERLGTPGSVDDAWGSHMDMTPASMAIRTRVKEAPADDARASGARRAEDSLAGADESD